MKVVIMAGGKGIRFWPWSVKQRPKQFLSLTSGQSLVQQTYFGFRQHLAQKDVHVVTIRDYLPLLQKHLPELPAEQIIIEPAGRDTAPCIAYTAHRFLQSGSDDVIVTAPADHSMDFGSPFRDAMQLAASIARRNNRIVTLGIRPTRPETGYGYIEADAAPVDGYTDPVFKVKSFKEKPTLEQAQSLIAQPNIYWNSGIFLWKPSTIAWHMRKYQPALWALLEDSGLPIETVYDRMPELSVDYAILEKARSVYTVPVQFHWDDIGTWSALKRLMPGNAEGNLTVGDVRSDRSANNIVKVDDKPALIIGVRDLIIVSTGNGLLVCHRSEEAALKKSLKKHPELLEGGRTT